jgi:hypothetical protein
VPDVGVARVLMKIGDDSPRPSMRSRSSRAVQDLGDLADLYQALTATAPDIGCYRTAAALEVGVAGRHRFPHPAQILG